MEFKDQEYFQEKFNLASSTGQSIEEKSFEECKFTNCSFIDCTIKKSRFIQCEFSNCVFSAIKPTSSRFIDVKYVKSKVMSFDWSQTEEVRDLQFENCQLDYSNFRMVKATSMQMIDCSAKGVAFEEADLSKGVFKGTDFEEATFNNTKLTEANFEKAQNYVINPNNNNIKKARFSYPEVMSLLTGLDIVIE